MKNDISIRLRAPEPDDIDTLYRWENDPTQWKHALTPPVTSRHHLWQFVNDSSGSLSAEGQSRYIIETDTPHGTAAAGTVDLCDYDCRNRTAWVCIYVEDSWRGRGLGSAALKRVSALAAECFGLERLAAFVGDDNEASKALFSRAGFMVSGRLPGWLRRQNGRCDMLIFTSVLE